MLKIGYIYRMTLAFVLLSVGTFAIYTGWMLNNLSVISMGYLTGMIGASVATFSEMRRITEGVGR